MAPRNKRKRQASHTSASAHTCQRLDSFNRRCDRPSLPSQPSSHRGSVNFNPPSQTASHGHPSPRDGASTQLDGDDALDHGEVNEDLEQVVLAIDRQRKGTVGCAYYSAREEKLYCLQDMENGTMDAVESCESFV
jgi:DNA mismatch repair protein MSH5